MANIKDIAKKAGVSVATVSRALKQPDLVKESTRNTILLAISELEYRPNALARGLRRQKSDSVVVVVPFIHNPFFSGIVQGIENVAHSHGYKVLLGESQNNQERLDSYADMLMTKEADGLILLGALLPREASEELARTGNCNLPLVLACEYFEEYQFPNVRIDNIGAARKATEHLIDLGHKRIAKITGPMDNSLARDRLRGYRDALQSAQIPFDENLVTHSDFAVRSGYEAMKHIFQAAPDVTSVFCANDETALGAIRAIKERGLSLPDDISIVGFDNVWFSEFTDPPLTTISQPQLKIGETAMKMMLDISSGNMELPRQEILQYELIIRGSTASVKS